MKKRLMWLFPMLLVLWAVPGFAADKEIDKESGFIIAPGFEEVKKTCTVCHSSMLVTQNKADREGWLEMIRWMQEKQGLWKLEPTQSSITSRPTMDRRRYTAGHHWRYSSRNR
jgi:hypothetical protein